MSALAPQAAFAADYCGSGVTGTPNNGWPGTGACNDICQVSGGVITCDLAQNEDDPDVHDPAWIVAVYDRTGTSTHLCGADKYCMWGEDVDGDDFRCSFDDDDIDEVSVTTGIDDDHVWFTYSNGTNTFNMDAWSGSAFIGRVAAKDGDDVVTGSRSMLSQYLDKLNGDDGEDILCGRQGDDEIDGGAHADRVIGEDGDDTVLGGTGNDYLCGIAGDDALLGGTGSDQVQSDIDGTESVGGGPDYDYCSGDGDGTCEDTITIADECDVTF